MISAGFSPNFGEFRPFQPRFSSGRNRFIISSVSAGAPASDGKLPMGTVRPLATGQSLSAEALAELRPCLDNVVTEDDTPVDSMFSEKQHRLLTEPL
jgi:hypothetical protein